MTGRTKEETAGLSLLGNKKTEYPDNYAPQMLETFINKHQDRDYFVKFNCPEFTSLCPITGHFLRQRARHMACGFLHPFPGRGACC